MSMKNDKTYKANLKAWAQAARESTITKKIYRSTQAILDRLMDHEGKVGKRPSFVEMIDTLAQEGLKKRGLK